MAASALLLGHQLSVLGPPGPRRPSKWCSKHVAWDGRFAHRSVQLVEGRRSPCPLAQRNSYDGATQSARRWSGARV